MQIVLSRKNSRRALRPQKKEEEILNVNLDDRAVRSAKKAVAGFLKKVDEQCKLKGEDSLYFTTLIIMHIMSQNLIDTITPEEYKKILDDLNKKDINNLNKTSKI